MALSIASSQLRGLAPAGTRHNIINGPSDPMKLYTLLRAAEPSTA